LSHHHLYLNTDPDFFLLLLGSSQQVQEHMIKVTEMLRQQLF